MHAILPLISSNWHSSGQHNPTFSVWTSPVLHASAQLRLHQSSANQASEELLCSCLHFSSEVRTTSQTWWVLTRGTNLVTGGFEKGEMGRGTARARPPFNRSNKTARGYICNSSWAAICFVSLPLNTAHERLQGRESHFTAISEHQGKRDFPHQLEANCSANC